jgi:hypothetical protein
MVLNRSLNGPGVQQVCQVWRERVIGSRTECETVDDITSLPRSRANAKRLLQPARDHWGAIENGLHDVRDEVLGEDCSAIFRGDAPQNLSTTPWHDHRSFTFFSFFAPR